MTSVKGHDCRVWAPDNVFLMGIKNWKLGKILCKTGFVWHYPYVYDIYTISTTTNEVHFLHEHEIFTIAQCEHFPTN